MQKIEYNRSDFASLFNNPVKCKMFLKEMRETIHDKYPDIPYIYAEYMGPGDDRKSEIIHRPHSWDGVTVYLYNDKQMTKAIDDIKVMGWFDNWFTPV